MVFEQLQGSDGRNRHFFTLAQPGTFLTGLGHQLVDGRGVRHAAVAQGLGSQQLRAQAVGTGAEACRDGRAVGLFGPVGDIGRTAEALELVLFDEATRAKIRTAAPVTLAKFDWTRAARETLAVLVNAF